jgi:hypothetical protein
VLRLLGLPVHLIDQHHFFPVGFLQAEAALVDLQYVSLDPRIGAGEHEVYRIVR